MISMSSKLLPSPTTTVLSHHMWEMALLRMQRQVTNRLTPITTAKNAALAKEL